MSAAVGSCASAAKLDRRDRSAARLDRRERMVSEAETALDGTRLGGSGRWQERRRGRGDESRSEGRPICTSVEAVKMGSPGDESLERDNSLLGGACRAAAFRRLRGSKEMQPGHRRTELLRLATGRRLAPRTGDLVDATPHLSWKSRRKERKAHRQGQHTAASETGPSHGRSKERDELIGARRRPVRRFRRAIKRRLFRKEIRSSSSCTQSVLLESASLVYVLEPSLSGVLSTLALAG